MPAAPSSHPERETLAVLERRGAPRARVGAGELVVRCEGLVVRYGPLTAVDGLSFHAAAGEVLALLGPNGAGKTSTLQCVMGYRLPSAGQLWVHGLDPLDNHRQLVGRMGVMLQQGGLYPMLGPARRSGCSPATTRSTTTPSGCSSCSPWKLPREHRFATFRAVSASGCLWRWRLWGDRICWCSTNPRPGSTLKGGQRCGRSSMTRAWPGPAYS